MISPAHVAAVSHTVCVCVWKTHRFKDWQEGRELRLPPTGNTWGIYRAASWMWPFIYWIESVCSDWNKIPESFTRSLSAGLEIPTNCCYMLASERVDYNVWSSYYYAGLCLKYGSNKYAINLNRIRNIQKTKTKIYCDISLAMCRENCDSSSNENMSILKSNHLWIRI